MNPRGDLIAIAAFIGGTYAWRLARHLWKDARL